MLPPTFILLNKNSLRDSNLWLKLRTAVQVIRETSLAPYHRFTFTVINTNKRQYFYSSQHWKSLWGVHEEQRCHSIFILIIAWRKGYIYSSAVFQNYKIRGNRNHTYINLNLHLSIMKQYNSKAVICSCGSVYCFQCVGVVNKQ